MKFNTPRRAELRSKVLIACQDLIDSGVFPSGNLLRERCPGHCHALLVRIRDQLVAEQSLNAFRVATLKGEACRRSRIESEARS